MRLDKFILLPGYLAERILISAAIEQIADSACIANNSNLVPKAPFLLLEREREWTLGTRLKQPQPPLMRFQKPSFSCNKTPLKALRPETQLGVISFCFQDIGSLSNHYDGHLPVS